MGPTTGVLQTARPADRNLGRGTQRIARTPMPGRLLTKINQARAAQSLPAIDPDRFEPTRRFYEAALEAQLRDQARNADIDQTISHIATDAKVLGAVYLSAMQPYLGREIDLVRAQRFGLAPLRTPVHCTPEIHAATAAALPSAYDVHARLQILPEVMVALAELLLEPAEKVFVGPLHSATRTDLQGQIGRWLSTNPKEPCIFESWAPDQPLRDGHAAVHRFAVEPCPASPGYRLLAHNDATRRFLPEGIPPHLQVNVGAAVAQFLEDYAGTQCVGQLRFADLTAGTTEGSSFPVMHFDLCTSYPWLRPVSVGFQSGNAQGYPEIRTTTSASADAREWTSWRAGIPGQHTIEAQLLRLEPAVCATAPNPPPTAAGVRRYLEQRFSRREDDLTLIQAFRNGAAQVSLLAARPSCLRMHLVPTDE